MKGLEEKGFISIKKNQNNPRIILIQNQNNHLNFLSAFLAANITQCHVFLCSKKWQDNEWVEVLNLIKPHFILGNNHLTDDNFMSDKTIEMSQELQGFL